MPPVGKTYGHSGVRRLAEGLARAARLAAKRAKWRGSTKPHTPRKIDPRGLYEVSDGVN
jgi:hypothetical protein